METIVLFGDSIIAGYTDGEITTILTDLLAENRTEATILNAGMPGDTTREGLKRMEERVLRHSPDKVLIFFGANDVADHHYVPLEEYIQNLMKMIEKIGAPKCVLCTPPYVSQKVRRADRPLERIQDYANGVRDLAQSQELPLVDILSAMLQFPEVNKLLQSDGLHFSKEGYQFLSQEFLRKL